MKSLSQAAAFLSLISTSFSISVPAAIPAVTSSPDLQSVAGSSDGDAARIKFSVPCPSCVVGTDDGLHLDLEIASTTSECTGAKIRLNDRWIEPSAHFETPKGSVWIETVLSNGLGSRRIHATWEATCILGQASLLSFKFFETADTEQAPPLAGFTTSFHQTGHPEFLRLQARPNAHIDSQHNLYDWLYPPRGPLELHRSPKTPISSLELELDRLRQLYAEEDEIRDHISELESKIESEGQLEQSHCSGILCKVKCAIHKASRLGQLVSHEFHHDTRHGQVKLDNNDPTTAAEGASSQSVDAQSQVSSLLPSPPSTPFEAFHPPPPVPPSWQPQSPNKEDQNQEDIPPWMNFPGFRPPHPWSKPPFSTNQHPHPPFHHPHHSHHGAFHRQPPPNVKVILFIAVGGLVLLVAASILVFACVRRQCVRLRDPRRRADCAAKREEKRRRHLYRKAACKYRWKTFLNRFRRTTTTTTDENEEKQGFLSERPEADGNVMHDEISNLRAAHKLVGDMMKAEEGDAGYNSGDASTSYPYPYAAEQDSGDRNSLRSGSLPAYSLPPPSYGHGVDGDISIIDGFTGYTPSSTDETSDSSVVDCSPRLSFETQRTTHTRSSLE